MFSPCQSWVAPVHAWVSPYQVIRPLEYARGAFPVPQSLDPQRLPPEVKEAILRPLQGPPKPSVTPAVMNATQNSMIAPDLPFRSDM